MKRPGFRVSVGAALLVVALAPHPASGLTSCSFPGGMYAGNNHCKYAQARVDVRCTDSHTTTTGTACYELQFLRFNYRGGTADLRSPKTTGSCAQGSDSGMKDWNLSYFSVYRGQTILYTPSTAHYATRYNCDIEAGPFYGSPTPFSFRQTAYAHYTFYHRCISTSTCAAFFSEIDFTMSVPS